MLERHKERKKTSSISANAEEEKKSIFNSSVKYENAEFVYSCCSHLELVIFLALESISLFLLSLGTYLKQSRNRSCLIYIREMERSCQFESFFVVHVVVVVNMSVIRSQPARCCWLVSWSLASSSVQVDAG